MATSIFVNNVTTSVPGVYSTIDASGLAQTGLTATGIIALLGTAQGGLPYTSAGSDASLLPRFTTPQQLQSTFAQGDLREAGAMLFDPSADANVQGGAQVVIGVQVNDSVQASISVPAASGVSFVVKARNYGNTGNTLTISISAATNGASQSVLVVLRNTQTGTLEVADNLSDVASIVTWINQNSRLVTASAAPNASMPAATASPLSLQGGMEKAATFADWQRCLTLLKSLRVNSVVALSSDPAVAAAVEAHCAYMCGQGRSERDGFVGIGGTAGALPTLAQIKSATQALGSRHIRAFSQSVARYDTAGNLTVFAPHFLGALAAGMQAGAGLGQPLTFKYIKALALYQDVSWNPVDNADDLIGAGAMIAQRIDGTGIRWVRNVTTYLADNNLAFIEGSTNASVNFVAFTMRQTLEFAVGRPGFAGTVNAVKSAASAALGLLVTGGYIGSFTTPTVTPQNDTFLVAFGVAPALPVNFIPISIFLQATPAAAA